MADQLRHITTIESLAGFDEIVATVGALVHALSGGSDHDGGIIPHHRDRMRVELDAFFYVLPILAAVSAAHDPTFFDGAQNHLRIVRLQSETLDVAHVGWSRKSPINGFG